MSAKTDLEAALRERPDDLATLAVYADLLIDEGDGRGEQIALELARPERHALLRRWLASELEREPGGDHLFVTDASWIDFLGTPIGEFCRGASALARMEDAIRLVEAIAAKPRPFMTRFKLTAGFDGPLVLDQRHVAAMPNLVDLELDGDLDLRAFRHPRVEKLTRASWSLNGIASWTLPLDLPRCTTLVVDAKPWSKKVSPSKVTFEGLPALRVLDVSELEPRTIPKSQREGTNLDVLDWLLDLRWLPQLERLRLPSVRTKSQAKQLRKVIERAPHAAIEVVRTYSRCAAGLELASPRVRIAAPWPWLPEDHEHAHWKFRLTAPGGTKLDLLSGAIGHGLERVWTDRDEAFRTDWREIWRALDACERKPQQVPFSLLLRGFTGFEEGDYGSASTLRGHILALADRISHHQLVTLGPG